MISLPGNWSLLKTQPNEYTDPAEIACAESNWILAHVPGTAALSLREAGLWSIDDKLNFDDYDFWYKIYFNSDADIGGSLQFDGLATLCQVWLNDVIILESDNMFVSHLVDISKKVKPKNILYLCFRSLSASFLQRRSRPKWKTKLVDQQQLRWTRTTLLGRIPGWSPPVAPVGPWKAISLCQNPYLTDVEIKTSINGSVGKVFFSCILMGENSLAVSLIATLGQPDGKFEDNLSIDICDEKIETGVRFSGELSIDNVEKWWPHTHGEPVLYSLKVDVLQDSVVTNSLDYNVGFKHVSIDRESGNFIIKVNHETVFCRGACWTINDIVSLTGTPDDLENTLRLMRDAGANMIRIGGTMIYEQDLFYRLCDEFGIMIWQDFMFANMDYPTEDELFIDSIQTEAAQVLCRLKKHACVSVYCGNSEIEQQASMVGIDKKLWRNEFFASKLPKLCEVHHPDVPYVSSSPLDGVFPFSTDTGITHYYGVGAYFRPVSEVRKHNVKFTSECLGFANIPVERSRNKILNGQLPVTHHPKWKERTPRDSGAGWDFEDVRDFYLGQLFSVDPVLMRSFESEKYFALSEVVTGEIMSQVFSEWRSKHSDCSGGLVWFLKDLWLGAGWGIVDSMGVPKACYYALKRIWQPVNVFMTDESLNGIDIHIVNEQNQSLEAELSIDVLNHSVSIVDASVEINTFEIKIGPRDSIRFQLDEILGHFYDTTYSYRFGPAKHDVVTASLKDSQGRVLSSAFYFPNNEIPAFHLSADISLDLKKINDEIYELYFKSNKFLYAVCIDTPGYLADDNFFHLAPNTLKVVIMRKYDNNAKDCKGYLTSLNLESELRIRASQ